jgi:L-seryl-tRNA(Ser) seleniumtransferase
MSNSYRSLPSIDRILADDRIGALMQEYSRDAVVDLARSELDQVRRSIRDGEGTPDFDAIVAAIAAHAGTIWRTWPEHVINATGVILHTNLGRAPLSKESIAAIQTAASGYSDLELDLKTGRRGSRQAFISSLITQATGAEAAIAVNNNASALTLGLAALAAGKEVIVSRGEAVEIGGGFRVPDVLRQSGATLVEVGTTNRTYGRDYEAAITPNTGAILAVHASNFRVIGFTHTPEIAELVEIGSKHGIPVLHDLGSGCLIDTTPFGLAHEPMPQESVRAGVGLSFFSGDKLLGGPQAGIIAGTSQLIGVVSRHPLARAVRIDKLSMAALSATLLHYIRGEAFEKIPVWRMISMPTEQTEAIASRWREAVGAGSIESGLSAIGGGSLPGETLPSRVLAIDASRASGGATELARRLRECDPPIMARIEEERVLLDPRTVLPEEEHALINGLEHALKAQR